MKAYYTLDGFETSHVLREDAHSCTWARTSPLFTTRFEEDDLNRVLCIVEGRFSEWAKDYRLLMSNAFFENGDELETIMDGGRKVTGIINLAEVKRYIAAAAMSEGTNELALYISQDGQFWHRAEFGDQVLEQDAYTILESTNYSVQVDVMTSRKLSPMGTLFTSNSNGTYFTENIKHTNRSPFGFVDFEKIQDIQGIVLVNTVSNWEEVDQSILAEKRLVTSISFDDGRTWTGLKVGDDDLHLHSVSDQRNTGRIYSSPAPGIIMGVGNTGKYLKPRQQGDTYVSDDAGLTWTRTLRDAHYYEMGDSGSLLVAVSDAQTNQVMWSINHGKKWESVKLDDKITPVNLQTVPDNTGLKFTLTATKGSGSKLEWILYSLDFADIHERQCKDKDFEIWPARVDDKGDPTCIMGQEQSYRRRKAEAECFVGKEFEDPVPIFKDCICTDEDYECDYNFIRSENGKECILARPLYVPPDACDKPEDTFLASSGYRLIPGNHCRKEGGAVLDEPVKRKCNELKDPPANGKISTEVTRFKGARAYREYYYLERGEKSSKTDETIIMLTDERETYLTSDHGKTWVRQVEDDEIVAIYPHQFSNDRVYLLTATKKVYYSLDRGQTIHHFEAPEAPNKDRLQILGFHPQEMDWLLWTGAKNCDLGDDDCHSVAHVSTRGGEDWKTLLPFVRKCQFISREHRDESEKLVYCEQYEKEDTHNPLMLVTSNDWFEHKTDRFRDVINFATMSEFIIVALRDQEAGSLRVDTSIDGNTFANAMFPSNFHVPHQRAYTVLDSSTHAVFLHVTVDDREDRERGAIIKSNSNGTSYVMSLTNVNRNREGYVDFEKMQGIEGVAIANIVGNIGAVDSGSAKKLKTVITHNDGADWTFLAPPPKDSEDKSYDCAGSEVGKCSLHLHGYTERRDPRDTYSSPSAIGLMLGVGNVGEFLGRYTEGNTFATRDGGVTWHEVFKGSYMWEYGDQGSIIVLVKEGAATKTIFYSLNEGTTWKEYQFSDQPMIIDDISTVPSDASRNFLLWGKDNNELVTINLDFSGLTDKLCHINEKDPEASDSDYDLWRPKHPLSDDDCLFGHVAEYHRKKLDSVCYNGRQVEQLHNIARNCSCTRTDYECAYNYERQPHGECKLVEGQSPIDALDYCKANPDAVEYWDATPYRRIPLTTCQGGMEMELTGSVRPCPGKEEDFSRKHGMSGIALFFVIVLPIAMAGGVGYWVYKNWDGAFGRIRLGDGGFGGGSGSGFFDGEQPWIKWPVAAVSGLAAVLAAVPMVVGSIYRAISTRFGRSGGSGYTRPYTSRSSFQRGRGTYAVVDPDEDELLGESDEEA